MKILRLFCTTIFLGAALSFAQTTPHQPAFSDYPSLIVPSQTPHRVVIAGSQSRRYASILRDAATHPPDFAGHYILASWGCGASCVMAAAINAEDGKVVWVPFTICCWPLQITEPLEFKPDSHLLIVHGSRNENGQGTYYYALDDKTRRFVLIAKGWGSL